MREGERDREEEVNHKCPCNALKALWKKFDSTTVLTVF